MEEEAELQNSTNLSVEFEANLVWLGEQLSSFYGIQISQEEIKKLSRIVRMRMAVLSLKDSMRYFQLIQSSSEAGIAEWEELLSSFMNGETFFFRDSGQFTLLKEHILPTLIHRRQTTRSLRILSAGCSTGEEAYSVAILVDQLLPDRQNWEIDILGTDINFRSVQLAQQGIYGQWAFRKIDSDLHQQYFKQIGTQWVLTESIRNMVRFHKANLHTASLFSSDFGVCDFDLIICRNVFLYFHHDAIGQVVNNLAKELAHDGYFLTGHGELPVQAVGGLQSKIFPDSVIYQHSQSMRAESYAVGL